jgi:hypothetical protein
MLIVLKLARIMTDNSNITRRHLLLMLSCIAVSMSAVDGAAAKDGDSGGSGGGGDSGGDDGDNSGKGGGGDDGDDGDKSGKSGDEDDDDDDNSGSGKGGKQLDSDKIKDAVKSGKAMPLSKALNIVNRSKLGRVIDVKLVEKGNKLNYKFKVINSIGKVKSISMDAMTGRMPNFLGL